MVSNNFLRRLRLSADKAFMAIDSECEEDVIMEILDDLKSLITKEKTKLLERKNEQ